MKASTESAAGMPARRLYSLFSGRKKYAFSIILVSIILYPSSKTIVFIACLRRAACMSIVNETLNTHPLHTQVLL